MTDSGTYDLIVIGGGITGLGTARDCAMRGLKVLLVERNDIASGASGRNHGLLHSGARYAVKDSESAVECISENRILKNIAPHCIEDGGGLFITLPEDEDCGYGLDYQRNFVDACRKAGINAEIIDPREALKAEPAVNPDLIGAVRVPDASVDPFKLCAANMLDALNRGATILPYTEVTRLLMEGGKVIGISTVNTRTGVKGEYRAPVTVNAAGIWGQRIIGMAGASITMYPAKGALLVFAHRVNRMVINRCRKASDGDILVPGDTVSVIGTTSTKVPFEQCDDIRVTDEEVRILLREGCSLCPSLSETRILRAYAGVRPLVASDDDPQGRNISRGIICLDHETRDGISGLITITGGKMMTYRLMAERASDMVCRKLGIDRKCSTATTKLADPLVPMHHNDSADNLVCECEKVTADDVKWAVDHLGVQTLEDLRRRTRIGMGTCQGTYCIYKAARALASAKGKPQEAESLMKEFINERWKGMSSVGWGDTLREMEFMQKVYKVGKPSTFEP